MVTATLSVGTQGNGDLSDASYVEDEMSQGTLGEKIIWEFENGKLVFDEEHPAWIIRVRVMQGAGINLTTFCQNYFNKFYSSYPWPLSIQWSYGLPTQRITYSPENLENNARIIHIYDSEFFYYPDVETADFLIYIHPVFDGDFEGDDNWKNITESYPNILSLDYSKGLYRTLVGPLTNYLVSISHTGLLSGTYNTPFYGSNCFSSLRALETIQDLGHNPFFLCNPSNPYNILEKSANPGDVFPSYDFVNSLKKIPSNLFAGMDEAIIEDDEDDPHYGELINPISFNNFIQAQSLITTIPARLFDPIKERITGLNRAFENIGIKTIPAGLLTNLTHLENASCMCQGCYDLETIADDIFDGIPDTAELIYAFNLCIRLKHIPELWNKFPQHSPDLHQYCFAGCTQADNYDEAVQNGWA